MNIVTTIKCRAIQRFIGSIVFIALWLIGLEVPAQQHAKFDNKPVVRAETVNRARARSKKRREEVKAWAKAHGLRTRRNAGRKTIEIVDVVNGRPRYRTTRNSNAAISTATDLVRDFAPFNLNGSGVTIGLWDGDSVLTNHQEFAGGRVAIMDTYILSNPHATHVAGTLAAIGATSSAKGMAPLAFIDSYEWTDDIAEMTGRAASYPGESNKLYISNHSYGDDGGWLFDGTYTWYGQGWSSNAVDRWFGQYDLWAKDLDEIVYNAPCFLPFKAVGNDREDNPSLGSTVYYQKIPYVYDPLQHPAGDGIYKAGYDTIPTDGNAKNILTVGVVSDAVSGGIRSLSSATAITRSSWGPSDDGRIKPDVVANGESVISCGSSHPSHYYTESGSSMASPNACGSATLLIQHFSNLFSGAAMRASSLKGLILHTADDIGRLGPDYQYGWGLMNTLAAVQHLDELGQGKQLRLTEALLTDTDPVHTRYFIGNGTPIRITLCWTDAPSTLTADVLDDRTPRLVNDLDLKLIDYSTGTTNYPYQLDYNNPTDPATATSENNVDNVEQVYMNAPQTGLYTVVVDYDGSLTNNAQWYSLLIEGDDGTDWDADGIPNVWESQYFASPTGALAAVDSDADGANNLAEYISGHNPTNSESVFQITTFSAPMTNEAPFIVTWDAMAGRMYNVGWSSNLVLTPFTNISGSLPYPIDSYTDSVERAGLLNFYQIEVQQTQ